MPREKPVMQSRHYVFVAGVIKREGPKAILAYKFAKAFALDNLGFKPDKFIKACGVDRTLEQLERGFGESVSCTD